MRSISMIKHTHVRWIVSRDMDEIIGLDSASFEPWLRWNRAEWSDVLKDHGVIGLVIADLETDRVLGCVVYRLQKHRIEVLKLIVHPMFRRCGLARELLVRVVLKLSRRERNQATCDVPERSLDAQLLLRSLGWKCRACVGPVHDRVLKFAYREGDSVSDYTEAE